MEPVKVGGEIESWCTACKTMKWHVVVSVVDEKPAKVECHGCHKQHVYRAHAPGTKTPAKKRPRIGEPALPALPDDLAERLAAGAERARSYSPQEVYAVGDFVRHPSFGVGLVIAVPLGQKVELAFSNGRKVLVHRRGDAAGEPTLKRPPPRDDSSPAQATDAPPDRPPR